MRGFFVILFLSPTLCEAEDLCALSTRELREDMASPGNPREEKEKRRRVFEYDKYIFRLDSGRSDRFLGAKVNFSNPYGSVGDWATDLIAALGPEFQLPVAQTAHWGGKPSSYYSVSQETQRAEIESLFNLILALKTGRKGPLRVADLGSGRGEAARELAMSSRFEREDLKVTAVDAIDWRTKEDRATAKGKVRYLFGDATVLDYGEQDLILAIEVLQYVRDKLGFIANAYNHLSEGGHLIFGSEGNWMGSIRQDDEQTLAADLMMHFAENELESRLSIPSHWPRPEEGAVLMLTKKPGTRMRKNGTLVRLTKNSEKEVQSYYQVQEGRPALELLPLKN